MDRIRVTATVAMLLSMALFFVLGGTGAGAYEEAGKKAAAAPGNLSGKLVITGSSTTAPLVADIARRFQALHPEVQFDVKAGGSGRGLDDVRTGKADIGMVSRALEATESDFYTFPIARDGVTVMVHKENPVQALTRRQVIAIFTGKIANWRDVGGRDAPITLLALPGDRSSSILFPHYFGIKYADIKVGLVLDGTPALIDAAAGNPDSITYVSIGAAERSARDGVPVKLLPIDGVNATSKTVRSGDFPISRPLTLVTKELPGGLSKKFIDFAASFRVTDIVVKHDFIPYGD